MIMVMACFPPLSCSVSWSDEIGMVMTRFSKRGLATRLGSSPNSVEGGAMCIGQRRNVSPRSMPSVTSTSGCNFYCAKECNCRALMWAREYPRSLFLFFWFSASIRYCRQSTHLSIGTSLLGLYALQAQCVSTDIHSSHIWSTGSIWYHHILI